MTDRDDVGMDFVFSWLDRSESALTRVVVVVLVVVESIIARSISEFSPPGGDDEDDEDAEKKNEGLLELGTLPEFSQDIFVAL